MQQSQGSPLDFHSAQSKLGGLMDVRVIIHHQDQPFSFTLEWQQDRRFVLDEDVVVVD